MFVLRESKNDLEIMCVEARELIPKLASFLGLCRNLNERYFLLKVSLQPPSVMVSEKFPKSLSLNSSCIGALSFCVRI